MPLIKLEKCIRCMKCVQDCPSDAIDIKKGSISESCIHCGHCVAICPESTIYPENGEITAITPPRFSPEGFRELSAGMRTCRSYRQKDVDEETLALLVENMKHYPSASNARPLEIKIIRTPEEIAKLDHQTASTLIKAMGLITSPFIMPLMQVLAPKLGLPRLKAYRKRFIARESPESSQVCHHAPAVMLFHAPASKFGMAGADAYIWATNTAIYASTLGLGSCFNGFITSAMKRNKKMRAEFGIPPGHEVYAALLLGYPKVKYINEAGRESPEVKYL